ncbi:LysR family transcriptional regulator [Streptomyces sp. NPDC056296]|uniref:LysR family transcriptional regulator n=1 Tax=Streptomyces sp. NPDC056296 TaxID=3345775 RepID=UPI0035D7F9CB
MKIDPQRIIRLAVLVQYGSFGRAAEHLGVTQSALSQSIGQVEREIGHKVVERTAQGVVPTAYGRALCEHARTIDRELARAERRIRDLATGHDEALAVGTTTGGAASLAASAVCRLMESRPGLDIRLHEDVSAMALLSQLRDRKIDMVICHRPAEDALKGLRASPLFRARRVACVRAGHPVSEKASLRDLTQYPFVCPPDELGLLFSFPQIFSRVGHRLPRIVAADSIHIAKEIVLGSDAFALFSDVSVLNERKAGLLKALELNVPTGYWMQTVVRDDLTETGPMEEFLSHVSAACRALGIGTGDETPWHEADRCGPVHDAVTTVPS